MTTLSKSRFVSGTQCPKKLYFDVHNKELKPEVTASQQQLFNTGHEIGLLAQEVFPNGRDVYAESNKNWSVAIELTKALIVNNKETIYEAAFSCEGGFAALDILHHTDSERWAIEVKSSTSVKDYHIIDAAFQFFVMDKAGYRPDKFFLMHIDNSYAKNGAIDPFKLFHLEDITTKILAQQDFVLKKKQELIQVLEDTIQPNISIGTHCNSPFECDYKYHCWAGLPSPSVFELTNARGKDWELFNAGIHSLKDIPTNYNLNHRQRLQVEGSKSDASFIDKKSIDSFLNTFQHPLYFLDFETINPAVPILNETRPFQQIPFQYSLHILDETTITHNEFLGNPKKFLDDSNLDPRLEMIESLKKNIGPKGSIVAYNAAFEITRLKELSEAFPDEKNFINELISRFVDLLVPFKNGWYYLPQMRGSASIKSVLPAMAPEYSYSDLDINNGAQASEIFLSMIKGTHNEDIDATRTHLLKYCERDTYGMVVVYRLLKQVVQ